MITFNFLRSDYNTGDIIGVVINAVMKNGEKYRKIYIVHPNTHPSDMTLFAVDYKTAYSPEYVYDEDFCLTGTDDWKRKQLRTVSLMDYDFNRFISENSKHLSFDDCRIIFNNTDTPEYYWVYAKYYEYVAEMKHERKEVSENE